MERMITALCALVIILIQSPGVALSQEEDFTSRRDFIDLLTIVDEYYFQPIGTRLQQVINTDPVTLAVAIGHAMQNHFVAANQSEELAVRYRAMLLEVDAFLGELASRNPGKTFKGNPITATMLRSACYASIRGENNDAVANYFRISADDVPTLDGYGGASGEPADFPTGEELNQLRAETLFDPDYSFDPEDTKPPDREKTVDRDGIAIDDGTRDAAQKSQGQQRINPEAARWIKSIRSEQDQAGRGLEESNELELLRVRPSDIKYWQLDVSKLNPDIFVGSYEVRVERYQRVWNKSSRQNVEIDIGRASINALGGGSYGFTPEDNFVITLPDNQQNRMQSFAFRGFTNEIREQDRHEGRGYYSVNFRDVDTVTYKDLRVQDASGRGRKSVTTSANLHFNFQASTGYSEFGESIELVFFLSGEFRDVVMENPWRSNTYYFKLKGERHIPLFAPEPSGRR